MNLFEIVKYGVGCREAAERYGVEVNHYGMALCPVSYTHLTLPTN